jgi:hypothetical protein
MLIFGARRWYFVATISTIHRWWIRAALSRAIVGRCDAGLSTEHPSDYREEAVKSTQ